jgi:hypothetical protein
MRDRGQDSPLLQRILAAVLIHVIIFQIPLLPLTVSAKEPEYIAVLELHKRGTRPDKTRRMTDRFREELSRYRNLKVLSRTESKAILDYHKSAIVELGNVGSVQSQVAEAKKAYFKLALGKADELTQKSIKRCLGMPPRDRDWRALQEAYTIHGIVAMAQNRKSDATESFRKLVHYNPQVNLDDRYFAPSVIKRIERAKKELKDQKLGSISVSTKPAAADVYVNGVFKGSTPLTVSGYPEGEHAVSVKAANYISKNHVVNVTSGRAAHVTISLPWKGRDLRLPKDMVGFHRDQFDNLEELIGAAAAAAQVMRVRKLILVEVKREKGKDVVTAHIVDARLETFHRSQSVTADNIKHESAQVSARLATQVLDEMRHSIMDNPQGLTEAPYYGDVILIGKKKRSLLKNPWFWVGMGVLAAGGVTAFTDKEYKNNGSDQCHLSINFHDVLSFLLCPA